MDIVFLYIVRLIIDKKDKDMLDEKSKDISFNNVKAFVEAQKGVADHFRGTFDVLVASFSEEYLYHNVEIQTFYDIPYMEYKVQIIWEDDEAQIDYKDLGLHGYYSTNFQLFLPNGNTLEFYDGTNKITISNP